MPSIAKLPEITLTCRNEHQVRTRARGGQAVKCPTCRVSVWVPSSRGAGAVDATEGDELAQRWDAEASEPAAPLEPSGHRCPECESDMVWEQGRTLIVCPGCGHSALPPDVGRRYAELEVKRSGPTDLERAQRHIAEVRRRMALSQDKDKAIYGIRQLAQLTDPDRLPDDSNLTDIAVQLHSNLNHVLTEIKRAEGQEEFAAAFVVALEVGKSVLDLKAQFEAEHQRAAALEAEDEDEADEYEDADWVEDEAEDEPASAQDWQAPRYGVQPYAPALPRSVMNQAPRVPAPAPAPPTMADLVQRYAAARASRRNCQFDHFFGRAADRRLWPVQWSGGPPVPGEPYVYCCEAHNGAALEWIGSKGYEWAQTELLEASRAQV